MDWQPLSRPISDNDPELIDAVVQLERGFQSLDYERACEFGDPAVLNNDDHPALADPVPTPLADQMRAVWTHWAPCPTNGQPILMRPAPHPPA